MLWLSVGFHALPWHGRRRRRRWAKLFDPTGYYRGCIPCSLGATVVHVICIQTLNKAYRSVAERLTDWENHRTEEVIHPGSLVVTSDSAAWV